MVRQVKFQDITVPAPGFGAMSLSAAHGETTDEASFKTLAKALEIGATFWDTARVYGGGHNETLIGRFFAQNAGSREKVFIASKCGFEGGGVNSKVTNSPEHIRSAIQETIKCLGSAPDLYYLHRIDPETKLEDSIGELQKLKEEGLTKYIGLSECGAETLRKACKIAHIDALQIEYSPWFVDHETDGLIDAAKELGVSIIAYSPLGKGMLTGTITDPSHFANDIRGTWPRYQAENFSANQRIVQEFGQIAKRKGVLPSQLAIAWVTAQGAIPIPGTRSADRVVENTEAADVELNEDELKAIRKVIEEAKPQGDSAIPIDPYSLLGMSGSTRASPEPADPQTTAHLLSLPAFLLPLSPSLAALHHARVKLHLSPSPTSINAAALKELDRRMKREAKGWCVHCGALKARGEEGAGTLGPRAGKVDCGRTSGRGKGSTGGRGKRRKLDQDVAMVGSRRIQDSSSFDAPDTAPTTITSSTADSIPVNTAQSIGMDTPPASTSRANDCDTCGTPYSRPSPLKGKLVKPDLPPSRTLRKRKSTVALSSQAPTAEADVFGGSAVEAIGKTDMPPAQAALTPSQTGAAHVGSPPCDPITSAPVDRTAVSASSSAPTKPATTTPKAKQAPPFRFIPSTPSSLPSYPPPSSQPSVRPETDRAGSIAGTAPASTGNSNAPPGSAATTTARKKSKKSGLAKLLAQSKEREQSGSTGNWGLG